MKVFPWGHLDARLGKGQTVARLGRGQSDARLERGQDTEDFLLAAHRGVDWSQKAPHLPCAHSFFLSKAT